MQICHYAHRVLQYGFMHLLWFWLKFVMFKPCILGGSIFSLHLYYFFQFTHRLTPLRGSYTSLSPVRVHKGQQEFNTLDLLTSLTHSGCDVM